MKRTKRLFFITLFSALLLLKSVPVFAAVELKVPDKARTGEEWVVSLVTTEALEDVQVEFTAEELEFKGFGMPDDNALFYAAVYDGEGVAAGTAAGTESGIYTAGATIGFLSFNVTAAEGETATLTIKGVDDWAPLINETVTLQVSAPRGGSNIALILGITAGAAILIAAVVIILLKRKKAQ